MTKSSPIKAIVRLHDILNQVIWTTYFDYIHFMVLLWYI